MSSTFQITNGTKPHSWPPKLSIKKDTLIELCARNYITRYGIINGVDRIFKNYT